MIFQWIGERVNALSCVLLAIIVLLLFLLGLAHAQLTLPIMLFGC